MVIGLIYVSAYKIQSCANIQSLIVCSFFTLYFFTPDIIYINITCKFDKTSFFLVRLTSRALANIASFFLEVVPHRCVLDSSLLNV